MRHWTNIPPLLTKDKVATRSDDAPSLLPARRTGQRHPHLTHYAAPIKEAFTHGLDHKEKIK